MSESFKEAWQRNIKQVPFQRALIFITSVTLAIILMVVERI